MKLFSIKNINKFLITIFFSFVFLFSFDYIKAADVFRVTEYKITNFSGTTYNLTLNNNLSENHFILIKGSETGNVIKSPTSSYVKISKLPSGTNKNLPVSTGNNIVELKRFVGNSNWAGVITVVECLANCDVNGFKTINVLDLSTPRYTSTTTRLQSGSVTSSFPWTNLSKVFLLGGGLGSGSNIEDSSANSGYYNSGWLRLFPSGSNTINWERYNSNNDSILSLSTHTIYAIEWGSAWNIQRTSISGSRGRSGANSTQAYNSATISSVNRSNTWVFGLGHSQAAASGNGSFGTLVTLGNGVNKNATETTVSIGSQINNISKLFEIYVMSHPNLSVDYQFKTNGGNGVKTSTLTTTSNPNTTNRMAINTSSTVDNTNSYPSIITSSRYTSNTVVTLEREYYPSGTSFNYASWVQAINFKNIQYTPEPTLDQFYYKWRSDTVSLNSNSSWISNENSNPQLFGKNINYRIRFGISNTGLTDPTSGRSFKLQYGIKTTSSCDDISSWVDMGSNSNFIITDSTYYSNQELTTNLFNNPNSFSFINGYGLDSSNTSNQVSLPSSSYTEIEYNIKASNNLSDARYCLRLYNSTNSKVLNSYSIYPEMLIGNYLVQDYYRWYENNNLITPINAISQENQEGFINEKEIARLRLNIQSQDADMSSKKFILKYSKNNINGPWRDVSNKTTGDIWWNTSYSKRRKINFGTNHSILPSGYTASFTMNTQVGKNNGDDFRIVFQKSNGENIELDRYSSNWYNTASKIEFKIQSDIPANSNNPSDGSYYVYYGNVNANNPPSNPNNIYAVYDDFDDNNIRSDWNIFDNDKASGTNFTESSDTLNINAGGIDTWESGGVQNDDYATVYQDDVVGDFEATVKCIYQDNIGTAQNTGIMIKNDITKTQSNNGYFVNVDNISAAYISAWDSTNNGYLDTLYSTSVGVNWPHCLRVKKQGTSVSAFYSEDCVNFTLMNTRSVPDVLSTQDIGIYVLSNGGNVLSLGRFDYFKLSKIVTNPGVLALSSEELKNDWEFEDILNLNESSIISNILLSNSNIGELYSEINPIDLSPNVILNNQRGEYDFPLNSKNAEKTTYYFKLTREDGTDLDNYTNYAKITIGNLLKQGSYRWFNNSNDINPGSALSNQNSIGYSNSKIKPVRLRLNIENSLATLKSNSKNIILQYSKSLVGPWDDVKDGNDFEFYDNNSVTNNSIIENTLLSDSNILESYVDSYSSITNPNPIQNNQKGEYDFSVIPTNATTGNYYFRIVKSDRTVLDDYLNYPTININTSPTFDLYSYKFFYNSNSADVGLPISGQNSKATVEPNSEFRLRILMSVSDNNAVKDSNFFKLYFAEKGSGTCANPDFSYNAITSTTKIALKNNSNVGDGVSLVDNYYDPAHVGVNIKNQTYKETGDFSNSISSINIGEDGKWDFALFDNNSGSGKTFCFKIVNADGSNISSYTSYPEVSILSGVLDVSIIDSIGNPVDNPVFNLGSSIVENGIKFIQGIFGIADKKIRITNTTSSPSWTVSISPTLGNDAVWKNLNNDQYSFNNPNGGGQMTIDPTTLQIIPQPGKTINGISTGNVASFSSSTTSITLLSSSVSTETSAYWDVQGINIIQSIPSNQPSGDYNIDMTLTILSN